MRRRRRRPWTCRRSTTSWRGRRWRLSATRRRASPPSPTSAWPLTWRRCRRSWTPPRRVRSSWPTHRWSSPPCPRRSWRNVCSGTCWVPAPPNAPGRGAVTRTSSWRPPPSTAGSTTPARSSGTTPRWDSARRPAATMRRVSTRRGAPPPASAAASVRCPPPCTTR